MGDARASVERMQNVLLAEPEPGTRGFLERHLRQTDSRSSRPRTARRSSSSSGASPMWCSSRTSWHSICARLREGEPGRSWDRDLPVIVLCGQQADAVDRVRAPSRAGATTSSCARSTTTSLWRASEPCCAERSRAGASARAGAIEVDTATRRVMVGDERVALPGKEYELLVKLAGDPHRVFKEELLREVWGFRSLGRTRTLDSRASRLRRRLARPDRPPYVQNVVGVGYACSATGLARLWNRRSPSQRRPGPSRWLSLLR